MAEGSADGRVEAHVAAAVVQLGEVMLSGVSTLVKTAADVAEHDSVPFLSGALFIVKGIMEQAAAVGENEEHVAEAGRRAHAVESIVNTLSEAQFPPDDPSFKQILEELAQVCAYLSWQRSCTRRVFHADPYISMLPHASHSLCPFHPPPIL